MGKVALWPIPGSIDYQLPGTYDAWRIAHMEAIVNGALQWISAAVLSLLPFADKGKRHYTYCMLLIAWTLVIAACFDPLFANSRGLVLHASLTNTIAFFLFYIGVPR